MARIKFTALVESIRGTIGGTTFQRNAFGYTAKSKPNMVNPNSKYQSQRKAGFQKALQTWLTLTDANRAAWNTYAATYPVPSHNNPASYLTGFNLFTRWHAIEFQSTSNTLANPSGAQGAVTYVETEIIRAGAVLELNISSTVTNGPWTVYIYLSRPLAATKKYPKSWTRLVRTVNYANPISVDIAFSYNNLFGSLPIAGDLVGVDITYKNNTNGQVVYIPSFILEVIP